MTERYFFELRETSWQQFESLLHAPSAEFRREAAHFPAMLRALTGDLNTAKANSFDPALIDRLNRLILDGNQKLCARRTFSGRSFAGFFALVLPRGIRACYRSFLLCCLLFYGVGLFSALLCFHEPEFAVSILGRKNLDDLKLMYNKDGSLYLKPRGITQDADMFGFYIYNNVSIGFRTFAGGIFAGAGSLFFLLFNALHLGAAAGYLVDIGYGEAFFSFVSGHSAFELTGIVLSAQAGLLLGYSLFVTKGLSRAASLRAAGKRAFPLIAGAAILDFLAAIIEAFWSSKHTIPPSTHYIFAAAMWTLLICYVVFAGRNRRSRKEAGI